MLTCRYIYLSVSICVYTCIITYEMTYICKRSKSARYRDTVRLARTTMEESGLTRWYVAELAVLYNLRACLEAKDYTAPPAGVI